MISNYIPNIQGERVSSFDLDWIEAFQLAQPTPFLKTNLPVKRHNCSLLFSKYGMNLNTLKLWSWLIVYEMNWPDLQMIEWIGPEFSLASFSWLTWGDNIPCCWKNAEENQEENQQDMSVYRMHVWMHLRLKYFHTNLLLESNMKRHEVYRLHLPGSLPSI